MAAGPDLLAPHAIVRLEDDGGALVMLDQRRLPGDLVHERYLRWQDVPVIVVTAVNEGPDMDTIRQYDVLEIFPKARYELSDLVAAVDRAVGAAPPPPDSTGPSSSTSSNFDA